MKTVGLLDGQTIQSLIFAKQIRKAGYRVVSFCDNKKSYGYFTRYANKKVICPSTKLQIVEFHNFFLDYIDHNELDVVVPMNDYSAKYLSQYKSELKDKVIFSIPDFQVFMNAYDKNLLMKICKQHNLPHPKSLDLSMMKKGEVVKSIIFPAIIKPNETNGALGFKRVNSFEEVWEVYDDVVKEYGNCHLQQYIAHTGYQYKCEILMKDAEVLHSTVLRKYRYYPLSGGSSTFNSTIYNKEILELCTRCLRIIGWEGFADFDLIEDTTDGVIKIMEINPRVPACLKASVISGIDFPNSIIDLSLKNKIKNYTYLPGKFLRYFATDLLWLFSSKKKFKAFKRWSKHLFSRNQYFEDIDFSDPLPTIMGSYYGFSKLTHPELRAKRKGMY